jgi:hypothetical protein
MPYLKIEQTFTLVPVKNLGEKWYKINYNSLFNILI